jgi:hypothetical protein
MKIRGLSGFGDAIYLEPLVGRYTDAGHRVEVLTNFPQVFEHLPVKCLPFDRNAIVDKEYSYLKGKSNPDTTQLEDMGYQSPDEFEIAHKPIALLVCGYKGMNSVNEFIPDRAVIERIIKDLQQNGYKVVHLTNGALERYAGTEEIRSDSYYQTLALFRGSDLIVCQQGWSTALAEGLNKRCLVVFSDKIRNSKSDFIRQITPKKVCCKVTTSFVWDNEYKGLKDALQRR